MMALVLIGVALAAFYLWLFDQYRKQWSSLNMKEDDFRAKVAVIIAFRNERGKLNALLDSIESLRKPEQVEFILVNDHSTDGGEQIVENRNISNLKLLNLSDSEGKKAAIVLARERSSADIYMHSDADCVLPENWLASMLRPFSDSRVQFVSGPVKYRRDETFMERFFQLDFAALNVAGAAHIAWGKPLMCNGANLAYRSQNKLDYSEKYASGDDVFLMQSIHASGGKLIFQKDPEAMILTNGPENWQDFIQQRLRWAGKNTSYGNSRNTAIMALIWLCNIYILIGVFFPGPLRMSALFLLACKIYADVKLFYAFKDFYRIREFVAELVLGQVYHIPYMALTPIFSKIVPYKWKGRRRK